MRAFETIDSVQPETDAKQQLTQYYEQLKQSILENDSYVDAMLETADAVYSVNLTDDLVERDFRRERGADIFIEDLKAPCPYGEYCHRHSMLILPETMGSYRLIDTAEKLLERYASGEKQVTVEYCERVSGGETRWIQKTALIIAMTANAFAEDMQASMDAGMNGHLSKPIVMSEVVKTIARNLDT